MLYLYLKIFNNQGVRYEKVNILTSFGYERKRFDLYLIKRGQDHFPLKYFAMKKRLGLVGEFIKPKSPLSIVTKET